MPRKHRSWKPGDILHVVVRAHSGAPIHATDEDREFVVERAARVFREESVSCLAWAILLNHYHMLLRFADWPRRPMARLNTAIAKRVRRLQSGEGPVFQDRYWGRPCADGAAVLTRLAYVTANPIHHRVVPSVGMLGDYEWSSFGEMTGRRPAKLVDRDAALVLLEAPRGRAVACLTDLLEMRVRLWEEQDAGLIDPRDPDSDAPLEGDEDEEDEADDSPGSASSDMRFQDCAVGFARHPSSTNQPYEANPTAQSWSRLVVYQHQPLFQPRPHPHPRPRWWRLPHQPRLTENGDAQS